MQNPNCGRKHGLPSSVTALKAIPISRQDRAVDVTLRSLAKYGIVGILASRSSSFRVRSGSFETQNRVCLIYGLEPHKVAFNQDASAVVSNPICITAQ